MRGTLKPTKESDKRRKQLVKIGSALPDAVVEDAGATHLSFKVRKKTFAYYLFDHHGDGIITATGSSRCAARRRRVSRDGWWRKIRAAFSCRRTSARAGGWASGSTCRA